MTFSNTVELPLSLPVEIEGQFSFSSTVGRTISIDPGGTTGWAVFYPSELAVLCGQMFGQHHSELYSFLSSLNVNDIVCEGFQFRQHRGTFDQDKIALDSVEYIGVIKLYSQCIGTPITFQTASVALRFVNDAKLERLGWYHLTRGMPHARDALRHLIYFLIVTKRVQAPFVNKWLERSGRQ